MTANVPQPPVVPEELRRWWLLPADDRRAVVGLSRSGRRHPDPEIAWVAWRWAQAVLPPGAPEPGQARNILSAVGFFGELIIQFAVGFTPDDPPAPRWLDRRRARRILRLGAPVG